MNEKETGEKSSNAMNEQQENNNNEEEQDSTDTGENSESEGEEEEEEEQPPKKKTKKNTPSKKAADDDEEESLVDDQLAAPHEALLDESTRARAQIEQKHIHGTFMILVGNMDQPVGSRLLKEFDRAFVDVAKPWFKKHPFAIVAAFLGVVFSMYDFICMVSC